MCADIFSVWSGLDQDDDLRIGFRLLISGIGGVEHCLVVKLFQLSMLQLMCSVYRLNYGLYQSNSLTTHSLHAALILVHFILH